MAQTVQTREPSSIVAGDTVAWQKALPDFLASAGWVLKYRLINVAGKYDITASASGDNHAVNVSAATSAAYAAGAYTWTSYVEKAGERYTVETGALTIKPNLAAEAGGFDTRSSAKKALDLFDAAILAQGASAWCQEYEIAGRKMKYRTAADFLLMYNRLKAEVAREVAADRIAAGLKKKKKITVRF